MSLVSIDRDCAFLFGASLRRHVHNGGVENILIRNARNCGAMFQKQMEAVITFVALHSSLRHMRTNLFWQICCQAAPRKLIATAMSNGIAFMFELFCARHVFQFIADSFSIGLRLTLLHRIYAAYFC